MWVGCSVKETPRTPLKNIVLFFLFQQGVDAPPSLSASQFYFDSHLFIFTHPVVSTDTKRHLKFLKLWARYGNAVTSYWISKLSKTRAKMISERQLVVALANSSAGNCSLVRACASGVLMLEPFWLTLLCLALNKRGRKKCHWGLQAFEVAKVTGCAAAGKRKPIKNTQRQNVSCERGVFCRDEPRWGRQLWPFQGHGAMMQFLKAFYSKFWLTYVHVRVNV